MRQGWFGLLGCLLLVNAARAQEAAYEQEPIAYLTAPATDRVAALGADIEAGKVQLEYREGRGYLDSVLEALEVPASSQVLVFSKTSFQRSQIGPETPRALYFNDDVYVGWVQGGEAVELSAADPQLGAVFYLLDQGNRERPELSRQTHECLSCHASGRTQDVPGHLVRSMFVDDRGNPLFNASSYTTDVTSPMEQRWGGWYVTGTHGDATHMGNVTVADRRQPEALDRSRGANVTDLAGRIDVGPYRERGSDIVALLVLEHQTQAHNALAWANHEGRRALAYQEGVNRAFGEPAGTMYESTRKRISAAAERVLRHLLFVGEAPLDGPVAGTSAFAAEFAARGPRDARGRSLRDFDLQGRLFRYPCSYLIGSKAFLGLPAVVKDEVDRRLLAVLTGADTSATYAHLSSEDRGAILEILRETRTDLPASWRAEGEPSGSSAAGE
jgi:hypothetical protein